MRKLIGLAFYLSFKVISFIQFRYRVTKSLHAEKFLSVKELEIALVVKLNFNNISPSLSSFVVLNSVFHPIITEQYISLEKVRKNHYRLVN